MNPSINIVMDMLGSDIRIAAYVYAANGSVVSRFDLIQEAPIVVGSIGDLRIQDAIRGFRALDPGLQISFSPDAEAINALEHNMPGRFERIASVAADAIAA
jgi:hypothetical protein